MAEARLGSVDGAAEAGSGQHGSAAMPLNRRPLEVASSYHSDGVAVRRRSSQRLSSTSTRTTFSEVRTTFVQVPAAAMATFAAANLGEAGGDEIPLEGLSFREAVVTMLINCVGAGIVLFPKAMADLGIAGAPIVLILCAATCLQSGLMVCAACSLAEEKLQRGTLIYSYEDLAKTAGGPCLQKALVISKNFAFLGFIIAYMQFVVESFDNLIPKGGPENFSDWMIRFLIVMPVYWVLSMLTNLQQLARFGGLGVIAVLVECGSIIAGGLLAYMKTPLCSGDATAACRQYSLLPPSFPGPETPGVVGKYTAVFLFTFAILATVPSVRSQLADSSQMKGVLKYSFFWLVVIDLVVMSTGYAGFGLKAPDNVIMGLACDYPVLGKAASVAMIVNVLISSPLFIFCIVSVFEASGSSLLHRSLSFPNVLLRWGLIVILNVIGYKVPYVTEVIGLVSSVFACCNNIIFPIMFHYMAQKQTGGPTSEGKCSRGIKYFGCGVVGLWVLVFGFQGSLDALIKKLDGEVQEVDPCAG